MASLKTKRNSCLIISTEHLVIPHRIQLEKYNAFCYFIRGDCDRLIPSSIYPFLLFTKYTYIHLFNYFLFSLISASRQIRRRVPYAGHLMTPRRLWLNKIPTLCDVVVEFPGIPFYSKRILLFHIFSNRRTRLR